MSDPKRCGCGRIHTPSEWPSLPFVGIEPGFPAEDDLEALPPLELRNCPCGSTLAVEMPS